MSHYGRYSEKQAISYMDGVHVKISEKYKPPRKFTLPVGFQHRIPIENVSEEEYDFKLEHSVVEKMDEWRKLRLAAVANRNERIKTQDSAWQDKLSENVQQLHLGPARTQDENHDTSSAAKLHVAYSKPTVSSTPSCSVSFPESVSIPSSRVVCCNSSLTVVPSSCFTYSNMSIAPPNNIVYSSSSINHHQNQQYSIRDSILTPIPISHITSDISATKTSSPFNISDFEADTSSPFDNMELKTINDLEELAHVLQPAPNSPESNKTESVSSDVTLHNDYSSPTTPFYSNQTISLYNTIGSKPNKQSVMLPRVNGYSAYGTRPRSKERDTRNENYVNLAGNQYDYSSSVQQELGNMYNYYPEQAWNIDVNISQSDVTYPPPLAGEVKSDVIDDTLSDDLSHRIVERIDYSTAVNHKPLTSGLSFPSAYNQRSSSNQDIPGRSLSKSVPDIVQELERELTEKRKTETQVASGRTSHTPPPRPSSFGSTGLENWKPWPDLDSPEQPRHKSSPSKKAVVSSLPNPFHKLSPNGQQLARHISEMGFALPRVARACISFQEDDKKVVEFLLQVQVLEERWPGDQAEEALVLNKFDFSQAMKYLEAMVQLLDLGFSKENVSQALLLFNNDRDRALDHLIS